MTKQTYQPGPLASVARTSSGGRWTLILTRELRHPIEKVWAAITDPEQLRQWSPYTASRDLATAGDAVIIMLGEGEDPNEEVPGAVLHADPPRLLEHAWGRDVLRWELVPTEAGTRLTLRHTFDDEQMTSAVAAGWHICLDAADALMDGAPFGRVVGTKAREYGWDELNQRYAEALAVEPSDVW